MEKELSYGVLLRDDKGLQMGKTLDHQQLIFSGQKAGFKMRFMFLSIRINCKRVAQQILMSRSSIFNNHQHSQFFFSPFFTSDFSIFILFVGFDVSAWVNFSLMGLPIVLKIQVMFALSFALHSTKGTPYLLASVLPQAKVTCLSVSLQSILLPTMILHMDSGWDQLICLIQFSMLLKDFLSVTEQTRMTPAAPLQYVSVIVLNLYWPAVSQICILILMPSTLIVFILKSTPIVVTCAILYYSLTQRSRMLVLPTAVSPMMTNLTRQSYFYSSLRFVIQKISSYLNQRYSNVPT